jgi:hypothetical protein
MKGSSHGLITVLSQQLPRVPEENHQENHSVWHVFEPRFDAGTSQLQNYFPDHTFATVPICSLGGLHLFIQWRGFYCCMFYKRLVTCSYRL